MIVNSTKLQTYIDQTKQSIASHAHARKSSPTEVLWSFVTYFLALACLLLIFVTSAHGTIQSSLLSPIVASIQSVFHGGTHQPLQTFSFVPGDAPNKFSKIDFTGLSILSFYDTPVNADGTLYTETDAYATLHSADAAALFETAHQNNTKVLLTLTMTYAPDILSLLDNPGAQQELFTEAAEEVRTTGSDGITLAYEYPGVADVNYRTKFSSFVKEFATYMHATVPNSMVSVAIPDTADANGMYDVKSLSQTTDKTLMMAYSFAVPESDNNHLVAPVYGFNHNDYLSNLTAKQNDFLANIQNDKLIMERAWYGNGNKYPLYSMDALNEHKNDPTQNTLKTPLTPEAIERLISDVPNSAKASARKNVPFIAKALEDEGILNANVLAYALATIQHETANTFEPIEEFKGRKSARRLGYEGGTDYFGRGFIQLTHLRNYQKIGQRIGVGDNLVKHPELASEPVVAAKVLAAYFKDFGIAKQAAEGNFVQARALINPDYNGESIAEIALGFLYALA